MKHKTMSVKHVFAWIIYVILLTLIYILLKSPLHYIIPGFLIFLTILELISRSVFAKNINFDMEVSGNNEKKSAGAVNLLCSNKSILPAIFLESEIEIKNLLNGEKKRITSVFGIFPKGKETVGFNMVPDQCGCIRVSVNYIKKGGFLGIFKEELEQSFIPLSCNYIVFPDISEIAVDREKIYSYSMESFKYSNVKTGNDPGEIFGIRDYQPNDSLKAIHWKLSEKMDNLVIRQMGYPVDNDILIILDKFHSSIEKDKIERLTEILFSLSSSLAGDTVKHDIGWYDSDTGEFTVETVQSLAEWLTKCVKTLSAPNLIYDGSSSISLYLQTENKKEYSNYIIISNDFKDRDLLLGYGNIIEFS